MQNNLKGGKKNGEKNDKGMIFFCDLEAHTSSELENSCPYPTFLLTSELRNRENKISLC